MCVLIIGSDTVSGEWNGESEDGWVGREGGERRGEERSGGEEKNREK